MARIRSIHPGLFTDELYMGLSLPAKALWPALWTEADDHGVFEWKPLTFKARLMPTDAIDMTDLMEELVEAGLVKRFSVDDKVYGVARGFCKWQRPKKPIYRFPLPDEFYLFAAWKPKSTEPVPHQSPTGTPEPAQRKEEGGRREEEGGSSVAKATGDADAATPKDLIFSQCLPWLIKRSGINERSCRGIIGAWMRDYGDDAVLAAMQQAEGEKPLDPVPWITGKFKPRENYEQRRQRENLALINAYEAADDRH